MPALQQIASSELPESGRHAALARCDREIAEMSVREDCPAWLVTLGVEDWEMEKRLIAEGHR